MNIEDVKKFEPFFGKWVIDQKLGEGSYGAVYKIKCKDYNGKQYFSALKVISIPKDENELAEAEISCGTLENTKVFFEEQLQKFETEIDLMSQFKGKTNIVSYEDHEIMPREGEVGFDVFVRMELLEDLRNIQRMKPDLLNNQIEIIRIGKDICTALEICQSHNIIHRDIKPGNIMRSADGDYKLGDFGVARSLENKQSMTRIGTLSYMAPEVENGKSYDTRADVYSLGMVLYELLNGNRGPFLPGGTQKVTAADKEKARERILRGQDVPLPCRADQRLGVVVQKACAFLPEERYQTAKEFRTALEHAEKQLLGISEEGTPQGTQANVQELSDSAAGSMGTAWNTPYNTAGQPKKKKGGLGILIGILSVLLLVVVALSVAVVGVKGGWFSGKTTGESRVAADTDEEDETYGAESESKATMEEASIEEGSQEEEEEPDFKKSEKADVNPFAEKEEPEIRNDEKADAQGDANPPAGKEEPEIRNDGKADAQEDANPPAEKEEPEAPENEDIHKYELYLEDVTWEQAFENSRAKNGYLLHIDSQEELEYIAGMIDEFEAASGVDVVYFWLGGRRYGDAYYWADADGNMAGERLDGPDSPYNSFWYEGEPSFGEEEYMDMFIKDGRYVWNDVPNDLIGALQGEPSGKIAYIIEYED